MAEINAKDVMKLRNETGLPMMDCKKALAEAEGDFEKAENILRMKLKGKMDRRTERAAAEGAIAIAVRASSAAMVEVRAETDFTAKNERFANAVRKISELALDAPAGPVAPTDAMTALVDDVRISTGENCAIARITKFDNPGGSFGQYVHHDGKTGVLIVAQGDVSESALRDVCMHIAAGVPSVPMGVTPEDVPASVVEKERRFQIERAMESGKPQQIAEKIVEGGMKKFLAEIALLEQPFVKDPSRTVKEVLGPAARIKGFTRWVVGEAL
ncbi:MAG TPA: translation elongation factor Ts [Phycisphaerales bacterium]|nr:translation elongation factor Ts [Phycisphaerales bacterium]